MQLKDFKTSNSEVQTLACKFCGRRLCKIGILKVCEQVWSPTMQQPPSCQPLTENVLGGLRQLTLQQVQQQEISTTNNARKSSQAPSSPRSGRDLLPDLQSSDMESTEDTNSRYQLKKHEFNNSALKLWKKLSPPPPLVLTISIAILAILISCTYVAFVFFEITHVATKTIFLAFEILEMKSTTKFCIRRIQS